MIKDNRPKRDRHALDADGMVLCNPRDKEAAHRAQMEGIATDDRAVVTCRKCRGLLFRQPRDRTAGSKMDIGPGRVAVSFLAETIDATLDSARPTGPGRAGPSSQAGPG